MKVKFTTSKRVPDRLIYEDGTRENLVNISYLDKEVKSSSAIEIIDNDVSAGAANIRRIASETSPTTFKGIEGKIYNYNISYEGLWINDLEFANDQLSVSARTNWYDTDNDQHIGLASNPYFWSYELRWDHWLGGESPWESIKLLYSNGAEVPKNQWKVYIAMGKAGPLKYTMANTYYRNASKFVPRYRKMDVSASEHIPVGGTAADPDWGHFVNWTNDHWMWWAPEMDMPDAAENNWGVDIDDLAIRIRIGLRDNVMRRVIGGDTLWVSYNRLKISDDHLSDFIATGSPSRLDVVTDYKEVVNPRPMFTQGENNDLAFTEWDYVFDFSTGDPSFPNRILWDARPTGIWTGNPIPYMLNLPVKASVACDIQLMPPSGGQIQKWTPRIKNGLARKDQEVFHIPEILALQGGAIDNSTGTQTDPKTIRIQKESASIFEDNALHLGQNQLYFWEDESHESGYPNYVPPKLFDFAADDSGWGESGDPSIDQKYNYGITIYRSGTPLGNGQIENYDLWNGRIWLDRKVSKDDNYTATYLIKQDYLLTVNGIDLNFHSGHDIPSDILSRGIEVGIIVVGEGESNRKAVWWYKDDPDTGYYLLKNPSASDSINLTGFNVINIGEIVPPSGTDAGLIKGLDTRTVGGGIKDAHFFKDLWLARHPRSDPRDIDFEKFFVPESDNFWDIGRWDGAPFSDTNFVLIRIPTRVRDDFISRVITADSELRTLNLTDQNAAEAAAIPRAYDIIRGIIDKYVALGVYWVVVDNDINEWVPSIHSQRW